MIKWIRKKLGYHICEDFTEWKHNQRTHARLPNHRDDTLTQIVRNEKIYNTVYWQERKCKICGFIQHKKLYN